MERKRSFVLPDSLYMRSDIGRLLREIESLQDAARMSKVRGNQAEARPSRLLQQLIDHNTHDEQSPSYDELARVLKTLRDKAPAVHISFAANPSNEFMLSVVAWFRKQVHPYVMVQIGLQPSIAAGCVLRTPSRYFDLTMRKHFVNKQGLLVEQLRGVDGKA